MVLGDALCQEDALALASGQFVEMLAGEVSYAEIGIGEDAGVVSTP